MGSRWDGRLADAARMALETGNEFGKQARQLGAELIGAGSATDGLATIDPALLSEYVGKRNQRRIMELAAAPGAIDKSNLRRLGLSHDATHGLADARARGDLAAAKPDEAADRWWQVNEPAIAHAAEINQQARTMLWNMATQTLGGIALGVAAIGGENIQPRPGQPSSQPVIGLPRFGGPG